MSTHADESEKPAKNPGDDLPRLFGRYMLQSVLGEGGMAQVFLAELQGPAGFRKPVALKLIKGDCGGSASPAEVMDLVQEACLGGRLKHPNIVDVYELGEVEDQSFISMEMVDGMTLGHLIRVKDELPASVVLEISCAMAAGLAKAHGLVQAGQSVGLVHRDIKPSNILISWEGEVKIADFGIATVRKDDSDSGSQSARTVPGTPPYMSPEQILGHDLDGRSDLFALGLVITQMVLGRNPLASRRIALLLQLGEELNPPLLRRAEVERLNAVIPGLGRVVLSCLFPDREDRTPDAECLLDELQELQQTVGYRPRLRRWLRDRQAQPESEGPPETSERNRPGSPVSQEETHSDTVPEHNLRVPLDTFVGREAELAEVAQRFNQGASVVILKGPGGAGKTRASRQYARQALDGFAGGIWFVDLTEARSARGIVQATASVLQVPLTGRESFEVLSTRLGHAIRGRGPTLLVMDNFEQVVEHGAITVGAWRELAPEARFLITTREPLRLQGEEVVTLGALPGTDGVVLFESRARQAGACWPESEATRATIRKIVEALDGLPLAIELAAARARMLSPSQLLVRMSERFMLLRGTRQEVSERQATLRGAIDWSWNLLNPWEKSALAQLSVFRGGFFMDSAEAVLDLSAWPEAPWSLDVVGSLLDKSLIHSRVVVGQPRFRMYVSIQEYAEEKLTEKHLPVSNHALVRATRLRHARHFALLGSDEFIESLYIFGGQERQNRLRVELENLRAGVEAASSLGAVETAVRCALAGVRILLSTGPFVDGIDLLDTIERLEPIPDSRARVLLQRAWLFHISGKATDAQRDLAEVLVISRESGNEETEALALRSLGAVHHEIGQPEQAYAYHEQALRMHRALGNRRAEGHIIRSMAGHHMKHGQPELGRSCLESALAIAREIGVRGLEGIVLGSLGTLCRGAGNLELAKKHYEQSQAILRSVGNLRFEGIVLGNYGGVCVDLGQLDLALKHYERALAIHRQVGNRRFEGIGLALLAGLHRQNGQLELAVERYEQALAIHREVENHRSAGVVLGNLGDIYLERGDLETAERFLLEAVGIAEDTWPVVAGVFGGSLALIEADRGDFQAARELLAVSNGLLRGIDAIEYCKLLCKQCRVETQAGNSDGARDVLAEAAAIAQELEVFAESEVGMAIQEARSALRG